VVSLVFGLTLLMRPGAGGEAIASEEMVLIPSGTYLAGDSRQSGYRECVKYNRVCKKSWFEDEQPAHRVFISEFYIDKYEVTEDEFARISGGRPAEHPGGRYPAQAVTWHEALAYCRKLGKRLPTEAEWEKAARGGQDGVYPWGPEAASMKANFCDRRCEKKWRVDRFDDGYPEAAPVGRYPANGFGLYDMAGNVYEWVADTYDPDYYAHAPEKDPAGPASGRRKVIRGGSWINYPTGIRPADRTDAKADSRLEFVGFRCAR